MCMYGLVLKCINKRVGIYVCMNGVYQITAYIY